MQGKIPKSFQCGAALIEFAVVLPVLLVITVGIICYGYLFMLDAAVTHAAKQAAQAAVNINPTSDHFDNGCMDFKCAVRASVLLSVTNSLNWLPASVPEENVIVRFPGDGCPENDDACLQDDTATIISVSLNLTGGSSPLLPQITLPGIGSIPPLPATLNGVARVVL